MALGAWSLARKLGRKLILNLHHVDRNGSGHGSTIRDFNLSILENTELISRPRGVLEKTLGLASRTLPSLSKLDVHEKKAVLLGSEFLYVEDHASFEPRSNKRNLYLHSYLQDKDLIADIDSNLLEDFFSLRDVSLYFRETELLQKEGKSTAIHLRRGDYAVGNSAAGFGLLSANYYRKALHLLGVDVEHDSVVIYSDDIVEAESLSKQLRLDKGFVAPAFLSASESLLLMSKASKLVIANSSLSWWSGFLFEDSTQVVAPTPWFRGVPYPENLRLCNWVELESEWLG